MKLYKLFFLILVLICFNLKTYSQNRTISGSVKDTITNKRLPYASIVIKNARDSVINYVYSNEIGQFTISYADSIKGHIYFDMLGYKTKSFELLEFTNQFNSFSFLLSPKTEFLKEVVIEGQKNNVIKKIDRDVYEITKNRKANANDIYDILETLPGVIVDKQNGTIRFKGGTPEVMVDNMPANFIYPKLEMISIDDIENIELIDRSSLYGGEGKGGMINIKLKKDKPDAFGAYASTEYDYTPQDEHFSLGDNFLNLNYMTKFGLIFNNLNYKQNKNINSFNTEGTILSNDINYDKNDNSISNINQMNLTDYCGIYIPSPNFSFLYAFGYRDDNIQTNKTLNQQVLKNDINYNYNMNERSKNIRNAKSLYHIAKLFLNSEKKGWEFSITYTNANIKGSSNNNSNISYFGNFDNTYNYTINEIVENKTNYVTSFFNYNLNSTSRLNLHFSYLNDQYPTNTFTYLLDGNKYLPLCKSEIKGETKSTTGIGYGKRFGRFSIDATINYKYQKLDGDYIRYISNVDTNLLVDVNNNFINPSIRFKQSLNKHNDIQFGYSYTSSLGSTDNYIAFIDKQDPNHWYSGNPNLEPEYYHNAYFSYKLTKDSLSFSTEIFYKTTLNGINNIHYPISTQLILTKPENIANNQKIGTDISFWYQVTRKLSFTLNSIISYNYLNTGTLLSNNTSIEREQFNTLIKFKPRYTFNDNSGISLWLDYYPTEVYYYGTMQKPTFLGVAVSRKFFNKKLFINLSVENLFCKISNKKSSEDYMGIKTNTIYNNTDDKFRFGFYIYYMFKSGDNDRVIRPDI